MLVTNLSPRSAALAPTVSASPNGSTRRLAAWIAATDNATVSHSAFEWATHATLDWLAVTVAGASEPLVCMLREEYGKADSAPMVDARRHGALHAALINGAAGHALDFDDVALRMYGHPSVPVMPAALALAQVRGATGRDFLRAVVVGHEVESRIGDVLSGSHYERGFHATGTIGTFGAAAAAATLLGLDAAQCAHALGLAAAQAAGLKSMFGTMAKPFHAGKAAMNGVIAAQLAARGFTANPDAIEGPQGFAWTQADEAAVISVVDTKSGFAVEQTLFKYHASCYLTHSTIEAVRMLREAHGLNLDTVAEIEIGVPAGHRSVCDIKEPSTGSTLKFSIRQLALLALDGADTASLALYVDATALDPRYVAARGRVKVSARDLPHLYSAVVKLTTHDGRTLVAEANVGIPATDAQSQWQRLAAKACAIVTPVLGDARAQALIGQVQALRDAPTLNSLMENLQ